jgi:uncharacterized protein YaaQ
MSAPVPDQVKQQFTLMLAVVQAQDVDGATSGLVRLGLTVTRLPSVGGFLGRRNVTLMNGVPSGKEPAVMETLNKNCRQRVEYIAVPLESAPLPLPAPTPVTIGGATVFSLEIDHFEEF